VWAGSQPGDTDLNNLLDSLVRHCRGPALRHECGLKVLCVHARRSSLGPGHLRPFWSVHPDELRLRWLSGEREQARAFCDICTGRFGPDSLSLLWLSLFLDLPAGLNFLCFHFAFPPLERDSPWLVSTYAVNITKVPLLLGTPGAASPESALLFQPRGVLPVTTVTIFRYVAKHEATQRNVADEYSVEISGVSDLSFLFTMRFGAEV